MQAYFKENSSVKICLPLKGPRDLCHTFKKSQTKVDTNYKKNINSKISPPKGKINTLSCCLFYKQGGTISAGVVFSQVAAKKTFGANANSNESSAVATTTMMLTVV